jgi:hypothetical protein
MDYKATMHYLNNQNELRDLFWETVKDREISIKTIAKEVGINHPQFDKWFTQNRDLSYKCTMKIIEFIEKNFKEAKK